MATNLLRDAGLKRTLDRITEEVVSTRELASREKRRRFSSPHARNFCCGSIRVITDFGPCDYPHVSFLAAAYGEKHGWESRGPRFLASENNVLLILQLNEVTSHRLASPHSNTLPCRPDTDSFQVPITIQYLEAIIPQIGRSSRPLSRRRPTPTSHLNSFQCKTKASALHFVKLPVPRCQRRFRRGSA